VFGDMDGFNWIAENEAIAAMEQSSAPIKRSDSSCSTVSDASTCSGETMEQVMALGSIMDANNANKDAASESTASAQPIKDSKNKRICFLCRRVVWIGTKDDAPRVVGPCRAYPLDTDWQLDRNAQPYCYYCWEKETEELDKLGNEHRAKGSKKPAGTINTPAAAKKGKKKKTPAAAKKGKKKKTPAAAKKGEKNKTPAAAKKGKKKKTPVAAKKGNKKKTTVPTISQEKMDEIVKSSHDRSIAAAAEAAVATLEAHEENQRQAVTANKGKRSDKMQLGGVQGCLNAALEEVHPRRRVVPRIPWKVYYVY